MKLTPRKRDGIWMLDRRAEGLGPDFTGKRNRAEAMREAKRIMAGVPAGAQMSFYTVGEALDDAWASKWSRLKGAYEMRYTANAVHHLRSAVEIHSPRRDSGDVIDLDTRRANAT